MISNPFCKKSLNIETEKSVQTPFVQTFLSQYEVCFTTCALKHFKDYNTKLDHAELLSLNILVFN